MVLFKELAAQNIPSFKMLVCQMSRRRRSKPTLIGLINSYANIEWIGARSGLFGQKSLTWRKRHVVRRDQSMWLR